MNRELATARMRAKVLHGAGWIALFQSDYVGARAFFEEGLSLYRELEDKNGIAFCLINLGFVAVLSQRDLQTVPALFEEIMSLKPELTDTRVVAELLVFTGLISASEGDVERAIALHEEALALYREIRDVRGISVCLTNTGLLEMAQADHGRAAGLMRENLRLARETDNKLMIHYSFVGLAGVALGLERPSHAARLWGAAEAVRESFGIGFTPLARSHMNYDDLLADARVRLGETAFEKAWVEGKTMTQEEAVEYALEEENPAPAGSPEPAGKRQPAALTRREEEIAAFVALGFTNRRIAEELNISERTAATHVGRILKKLELASREQVAGWAAR